jgi:BirA family transcriptional regulator, biotin operon repressor / biotin---[acetyl-CoA-carboxylase] ligase
VTGRSRLQRRASIGTPRVHHRLTDSTNERARVLAVGGAPHGTIVTADEQTAGRGRQGRAWSAPPGSGVLMSLVVRDIDERSAALPLAAAVAVCDALAPLDCRIKWPNDVWLAQRKLAGILVEGRPQEGWAIVGIGLNVSTAQAQLPAVLRETATSLRIAGVERDREEVLAALLGALDRRLGRPTEEVLPAWRERDALRGEGVRWRDGEGRAAGIDEAGALIVETDDGRVTLDAGEVHLLR